MTPPDDLPTQLVLVGLPGAGKSTVGRLVAEKLGRRFIDLDDMIEARAGRPVARIFSELGEPEFRRLEREVTAEVAAGRGTVLAPGGGWLSNGGARDLLGAGAMVIYLEVTPETAARRLEGLEPSRPLLQPGSPLQTLTRLLLSRRAAYESADAVVNAESLTPQQVAAAVAMLASSSWRG